jgi:hypothetical protein
MIPLARSWNPIARAILGDWQLSGISPLSLRAVLYNQWKHLDRVAPAPTTRRGNAGVGVVQGRPLHVWDVSLRKEFKTTSG